MTSLLTFSLLYWVNQIDSILLCICFSVIDHRCQNVVRTPVTHSPFSFMGSCATFLFLPHFDVICDLLLNTDAQQHGISLLHICHSLAWRSLCGKTLPELTSTAKGHRLRACTRDRCDFQTLAGWLDLRFPVMRTVLHDFLT